MCAIHGWSSIFPISVWKHLEQGIYSTSFMLIHPHECFSSNAIQRVYTVTSYLFTNFFLVCHLRWLWYAIPRSFSDAFLSFSTLWVSNWHSYWRIGETSFTLQRFFCLFILRNDFWVSFRVFLAVRAPSSNNYSTGFLSNPQQDFLFSFSQFVADTPVYELTNYISLLQVFRKLLLPHTAFSHFAPSPNKYLELSAIPRVFRVKPFWRTAMVSFSDCFVHIWHSSLYQRMSFFLVRNVLVRCI